MSIFFTSDLHLNHFNIISYTNRPFKSSKEMNEVLVSNWNNIVKPGDQVYNLGDVGFGTEQELSSIIQSLNGQKFLIFGNHDKHNIRKYPKALANFAWAKDIYELKTNNNLIVLSHYSMRVWNKSHRNAICLFGHSHGTLPPFGKSVDVGVDSTWITGKTEYRPFSLEEIEVFMQKQTIQFVDHHDEESP